MDELGVESDLYAESRGKYPWHYLPAAVNAVFTLLSPFFGGIFYVTEENACHRGTFSRSAPSSRRWRGCSTG